MSSFCEGQGGPTACHEVSWFMRVPLEDQGRYLACLDPRSSLAALANSAWDQKIPHLLTNSFQNSSFLFSPWTWIDFTNHARKLISSDYRMDFQLGHRISTVPWTSSPSLIRLDEWYRAPPLASGRSCRRKFDRAEGFGEVLCQPTVSCRLAAPT